jgi:hypothetical protein
MTACIAATAGMSLWTIVAGATWLCWVGGKGINRVPVPIWLGRMAIDHLIAYAGTAVGVAWAVQVVTGRWLPAADWVEWLGRALGVFWIVAGLVWGIRLSWVLF